MALSKAQRNALQKKIAARMTKAAEGVMNEEEEGSQESEADAVDITKTVTDAMNNHPLMKLLAAGTTSEPKEAKPITAKSVRKFVTKAIDESNEENVTLFVDAIKELFGGEEGIAKLVKLTKVKFVKAEDLGGRGSSSEDAGDVDEEFEEKAEGKVKKGKKGSRASTERELKNMSKEAQMDELGEGFKNLIRKK